MRMADAGYGFLEHAKHARHLLRRQRAEADPKAVSPLCGVGPVVSARCQQDPATGTLGNKTAAIDSPIQAPEQTETAEPA